VMNPSAWANSNPPRRDFLGGLLFSQSLDLRTLRFIWIPLFPLIELAIRLHGSQHHDEIERSGHALHIQAGRDGRLRIDDESTG